MKKGILWNGKYHALPGVDSRINSSALARTPLGGTSNMVILGEMIGFLPPGQVTTLGDPSLAQVYIHELSAEARKAVEMAFDPSTEVNGASSVMLVPVNPATQATLANSGYTVTSYLYGLPANQIRIKQEAGTTGKKVSLIYGTDSETFDNLTKSAFTIQYTGLGSAATMTINVAAATHRLTTTCTDAASDDLSLDLNVYTTVQSLVDAIAATGKYTCTVVSGAEKDSTMLLDAVTTQAIKASPYTAKSDLQAIIDGVNTQSGLVSLERIPDAGAAPANFSWTYLAGAVNGTATTDTWQAAFDALKTKDISFVVSLTSDTATHAMQDAHVRLMSAAKKERRAFCGGDLLTWTSAANRTTSIATLKADVAALGSDRTVHAGLGVKLSDASGQPKLYPAYMTAVMYAGMAAGGSPTMPLTWKHLRCLGLEADLNETEAGELVDAGVAVPIPDEVEGGGYKIADQVTTWQKDTDLYRTQFSVGRGGDYTASRIRLVHRKYVGQEGIEGFDVTLVNDTNAELQQEKDANLIRSYDPAKTVLRADGMSRYIDYSAAPVLPIRNIFSTYNMEPTFVTLSVAL